MLAMVCRRLSVVALVAALFPFGVAAYAQSPSSSPGAAEGDRLDAWTGTWAAAPVAIANQAGVLSQATTFRDIVHVSLGGARVRVVVSNEFGTEPLQLGGAQIAPAVGGGAIAAGDAVSLLFSGHPQATIPAGALLVSDPVAFPLPAQSNVAVSLYFPAQKISTITEHDFADSTSYQASGDQTGAASLSTPHEDSHWNFLKGIEVNSVAGKSQRAAIVAFGDSITDGALSSRDGNRRWPDVLAGRLLSNRGTMELGVLNEGIGGNRVLNDGYGPNALARFGRDVLAQPGVRYLIVLEGINDIGRAANPEAPADAITADDLIAGLSQMATRAHEHGIRIFGATLTPFGGAKYETPAREQMREAVNQWIRTTRELDGVIDFEKATRDPDHPNAFLPAYDSGDHLHPNDAGYNAMGRAIDLKLFTSR